MNVGCHWYFQVAPDRRKNLAAFTHAGSTKRTDRSSICLVVRGFENEINVFGHAGFGDLLRHAPDKLLRLNHTPTENALCAFAPDNDVANAQGLCFHAHNYSQGHPERSEGPTIARNITQITECDQSSNGRFLSRACNDRAFLFTGCSPSPYKVCNSKRR